MSTSPKTIISAQVESSQRDQLARLAAEHDRSMSGEMRKALSLYLRVAGDDGKADAA